MHLYHVLASASFDSGIYHFCTSFGQGLCLLTPRCLYPKRPSMKKIGSRYVYPFRLLSECPGIVAYCTVHCSHTVHVYMPAHRIPVGCNKPTRRHDELQKHFQCRCISSDYSSHALLPFPAFLRHILQDSVSIEFSLHSEVYYSHFLQVSLAECPANCHQAVFMIG